MVSVVRFFRISCLAFVSLFSFLASYVCLIPPLLGQEHGTVSDHQMEVVAVRTDEVTVDWDRRTEYRKITTL